MASEGAVNTAKEFCRNEVYEADVAFTRASLADVPANDEGLRLLAANGNWSEVLALAEKLDAHVAAKARRHPTRYATVSLTTPACATRPAHTVPEKGTEAGHAASPPSIGVSPSFSPALEDCSAGVVAPSPLSTDAAVRNARLPYVLVQVTANLKMRRIVAAKKVIDELGDVEGEGFRHPVTRESFAPFSLRLIAAFLPLYFGVPMEAQKKLHALLEECLLRERQCGAALHEMSTSGSSLDGATNTECVKRLLRMWTQRVFRVQRALLHVHIHMNQQSLAHCVVEQVLRIDHEWHNTFRVLSDDLYQLRHVLHLQQIFCLALHVGDAQKAREVHRAIRQTATELEASSAPTPPTALTNSALLALVAESCDGFLAVFQGDYNEAVQLFRDVVDRCTAAKKALKTGDLIGSGSAGLTSAADGTISEHALRWWTLQEICANAQVSQVTCMAYCSDADPARLIQNLCTTMEDYAKAEPHVLCNSDPFVESMVRFYTLAGERHANLERLSDLLEVFRCDRSSLPNLEALV
ncbi:hypothetical protein ABB37_03143 [Leptomonas pyrrhocoris]|uniref:Uncharacterized protein n=1 Tax=Leptomonas pyrrhocoris TaxID=157538 RepID=A0A0N0DWL3_LEPPY|nr:hypothetical protein ABB37_03143 [Leptomonas pyrrhocoris]KPA81955.1 hypothetical protein ABB37_03143 [Leptomonas pyrrhocoris]|eukprot:XP_015660394.1 hypothetical protein ABB37_03143 [Leptomonas pyrrhocoris]